MELTTEKLTVKIDGVVHELSYPTIRQIKSLEKSQDDIKIDTVCDLLIDCGLKKEVVENLQANHMNAIVEALVGKSQS